MDTTVVKIQHDIYQTYAIIGFPYGKFDISQFPVGNGIFPTLGKKLQKVDLYLGIAQKQAYNRRCSK